MQICIPNYVQCCISHFGLKSNLICCINEQISTMNKCNRVGKVDSEIKPKIWFLYYFKSDLKTRIKVRSDPNTIKYFQIKCAEVLKIFLYGMLIFWFCHYCLIWYRMMITMIILQMDGMGTTNTWSWKMWLLTWAGFYHYISHNHIMNHKSYVHTFIKWLSSVNMNRKNIYPPHIHNIWLSWSFLP